MKTYAGLIADSTRWHGFEARSDDIIITTPSKCGTTWTQMLVGNLVMGRADFGNLSEVSLWYDACLRSREATAELAAVQSHRRFFKTHSPLDGMPLLPDATFLCVMRHPLDVALSRYDHRDSQDHARTETIRMEADNSPWLPPTRDRQPTEPDEFIRWWIDNDRPHLGAGALGLADLCNQAGTYWKARNEPNVHLFHYSDLWDDLGAQLRRLAQVLNIDVDAARIEEIQEATTLDAMRGRADQMAPEAHLGIWKSTEAFFSHGGTTCLG